MNTNRWSARPLTEGSLLAALTVVLAMLSQVLPLVGLFVPVPIVYITLRHGLRTSFLATVVAGLALAFTLGPSTALLVTATFGSVGLSIGLGARRGWPVGWTLTLATLAGMGVTVLGFLLTAYVGMGVNLAVALGRAQTQAVNTMHLALQQSPGLTAATRAQMEQVIDQAAAAFSRFWWIGLVLASVPTAVLQYAVINWTLRRMRVHIAPIAPFQGWRLPGETVLPLSLSLVAIYLGERFGHPTLGVLGEGVALLFLYAYAITGLSLGYDLLRRLSISKVSAVLLLAALFLGLGMVFPLAGFLDSLMDLRHSFGPQEG